MNEIRETTEPAQEQQVTSGDEKKSLAFIPTTLNNHHQESLRRHKKEEFMEMLIMIQSRDRSYICIDVLGFSYEYVNATFFI